VKDPGRYGVAEFDGDGSVICIEEKPERPRSNFAVTGLYFYDNRVLDIAARLTPSARGELEIIDVCTAYQETGELRLEVIGRGVAWLDTGTHSALMEASTFIETIENRQGLKIGSIEEVAWRMGYIDDGQLERLVSAMNDTYSGYLKELRK